MAINAAIAAKKKKSPDHAAVRAAIAAYKGSPPGFPFPRYGSVHSSIPEGGSASPQCGFDMLPEAKRVAITSAIIQRRNAIQAAIAANTKKSPDCPAAGLTTPRGPRESPPRCRRTPPGTDQHVLV